MKVNARGFVVYRENGSRLHLYLPEGLRAFDLGRISLGEAERTAWLKRVVLLVNGRIHRNFGFTDGE